MLGFAHAPPWDPPGVRGKGLGPESLWGRLQPPARPPGWAVGSLCSLSRPAGPSGCKHPVPERPSSAARPRQPYPGRQAQGGGQNSPPSAMRGPSASQRCSKPQSQACWQERIRRETAARVAWTVTYGHKYPKEGPVPRKRLQRAPLRPAASSPETEGLRGQLSSGVGVRGPLPKEGRAWEAQRATGGLAAQTKPEGLEMRRAPPGTLKLLFQGISHDGQGRASYLRERHRQKPEEKFLYPVLSSWEYGWHIGKGHHHLATPDLRGQARPSSPALSCHPAGTGLSLRLTLPRAGATHLHTFRPLHIFISPPVTYLPLPPLANTHMSPPLGSPPKVLLVDVSPPLWLYSFLSLQTHWPHRVPIP